MTIITEGENSFFLNAPVILIDDAKDVASSWASQHIYTNPAIKWAVARYVEADNANSNGQFWSLDDLRLNFHTVNHSPMNLDHKQNEIVGTWVSSELLYPTDDSSGVMNPYVEVLGAFWKYYFPTVLEKVEKAWNSGLLAVSMECRGDSVTCVGTDDACGETFAYNGPHDPSYCAHIKDRAAYRQINNPHFLGGALIIPPNKPGWKGAHVTEMSYLTTNEDADDLLSAIAQQHPQGNESDWKAMMDAILFRATMDRFTKVS